MGVNDYFWEDLLSHIRQQALVPVVGPELNVVSVGDAEQTLTTLIGRTLGRAVSTEGVAWELTMDEAVAAFLQERGQDELERLYRIIYDTITELDPAPCDALRHLAAIDDLQLFVSTTPDRLLAQAVNEVRFNGAPGRVSSPSPRISARANSHETANRQGIRNCRSQSVWSGRLDASVRDPRGGPAGVAARVVERRGQPSRLADQSVEASPDALHRLRDTRLARAVHAAHVQ